MARPFMLATAIDFSDDCKDITFTPRLLEDLLDAIVSLGTSRIYWNYDQPGQWNTVARDRPTMNAARTTENFGGYDNLIATAGRLIRERDMEFVAVLRPFEMGLSSTIPRRSRSSQLAHIGGFVASLDPWIEGNPELRMRAWMGDVPNDLSAHFIGRIQLRSVDMTDVRIGPNDLQLWTSDDNETYLPLDVPMSLVAGVDASSRVVPDLLGGVVTPLGAQVRTIDIVGLRIRAPYIALTTRFTDTDATFRNTAIEMVRVFDTNDRPLPVVVASHKSTWDRPRNFPNSSLEYDGGVGDFLVRLDTDFRRVHCNDCRLRGVSDCMQLPLEPDEAECRDGVIAFAVGRNEYVPGQPSESYPGVQAEWMRWVDASLAAGAQGIDIRISNHSGWTNEPGLYGYNSPVIDAFEVAHGRAPRHPDDQEKVGILRGDMYTDFLRRVRSRLDAAGARLHHHLEVESWRSDSPLARRRTQAGSLRFDWRRWLREGLLDEATLMGVTWLPDRILSDSLTSGISSLARDNRIPLNLRHHMFQSQDGATHAERLETAYSSKLVDGYILYDSASLFDRFKANRPGQLDFYPGLLEALRDRATKLGIRR